MKRIVIINFLMLCVIFSGCGFGSESGPHVRDLTAQEQALVDGSNQFGFELFNTVIEKSDGKDVFVSPLSVSLALGMTYNGARGTTEEQMRETLGYKDLGSEDINQAYQGLADYLINLDPKTSLEIANSLWYRDGFEIVQAFIDITETFFDAMVQALDFSDPTAADTINAWVDEKTHGKIDSIINPPISVDTLLILINAIYFKGDWTYEFDEQETIQTGFLVSPSQVKTVAMMNIYTKLPYLETETYQAVRLPYGYELFCMTILLPKQGQDINQVIASLNAENFADLQHDMIDTDLALAMPRFELEYETSLNDVLKALGLGVAFSPQADFSGIQADGDLSISDVKHKTYVKVDEKGTEAAAVTSVTATVSIGDIMLVNRPFLVVIHDTNSKALLFMGKIADPISD